MGTPLFYITDSEMAQVNEWAAEQDRKVAAKQERSTPNYGAAGGALTWEVTPTNLGVVIKVRHGITNEVLDITDYKSW